MRNPPKHARPPTKADETPEFCEAWKVWQACKSEYDGRASARDEFFRRLWWHGVDAADILDGVRWYAHTFKTGQFRLKFSTWLERGLYEDDADKWRAYQRRLAERQAQAVSDIKDRAQLPENHFSRRYERGEIKIGE